MIYLTGDTHGAEGILRLGHAAWPEGKSLTKDDLVVILGDYGCVWKNSFCPKEYRAVTWLDQKPWTTLVVRGNHENHDKMDELPWVDMFGKKVQKLADSIYILSMGEIYTINGETFLVVGGANSIDKYRRTEGISWWKGELLTSTQKKYILKRLEEVNYEVDWVLSHTGPSKITHRMFPDYKIIPTQAEVERGYHRQDPVGKFLQQLLDKGLKFKRWYFGHMHDNIIEDSYVCLYEDIIPILNSEGKPNE